MLVLLVAGVRTDHAIALIKTKIQSSSARKVNRTVVLAGLEVIRGYCNGFRDIAFQVAHNVAFIVFEAALVVKYPSVRINGAAVIWKAIAVEGNTRGRRGDDNTRLPANEKISVQINDERKAAYIDNVIGVNRRTAGRTATKTGRKLTRIHATSKAMFGQSARDILLNASNTHGTETSFNGIGEQIRPTVPNHQLSLDVHQLRYGGSKFCDSMIVGIQPNETQP